MTTKVPTSATVARTPRILTTPIAAARFTTTSLLGVAFITGTGVSFAVAFALEVTVGRGVMLSVPSGVSVVVMCGLIVAEGVMDDDAVMESVIDSVIVEEDVELVPTDPLTEIDIVSVRVAELDFHSLADEVFVGVADLVVVTEVVIDGINEGIDVFCVASGTDNVAR